MYARIVGNVAVMRAGGLCMGALLAQVDSDAAYRRGNVASVLLLLWRPAAP